ncbi:MAG: class I SAM-dependent methyltransferase [Ignavibacteriota bacterium]
MKSEVEEIKSRYKRRKDFPLYKYSILNPASYLAEQEKERAIIKWIKKNYILPVADKKFLEIGCGTGNNIYTFLKLGFKPENIYANELLDDRFFAAKKNLPKDVKLINGNALDIELPDNSFDVVFQSMVFSSILDKNFKRDLAIKLFKLTKPGGGILWYDFIYNNPNNPDVSGVSLKEVKDLFNLEPSYMQKITLAPPIARMITKIHPSMYTLLNSIHIFRTHLLLWIKKRE